MFSRLPFGEAGGNRFDREFVEFFSCARGSSPDAEDPKEGRGDNGHPA
jgi:hypothetical protein